MRMRVWLIALIVLLLSSVPQQALTASSSTEQYKDVVPIIITARAQGSGVFDAPEGMVTAFHVFANVDVPIRVGWPGGRFFYVQSECENPVADVATAHVPHTDKFLPIAIDSVAVNDIVTLAGWPHGKWLEYRAFVVGVVYGMKVDGGIIEGPVAIVFKPVGNEDLGGLSGGAVIKDGVLVGVVIAQTNVTLAVSIFTKNERCISQ